MEPIIHRAHTCPALFQKGSDGVVMTKTQIQFKVLLISEQILSLRVFSVSGY